MRKIYLAPLPLLLTYSINACSDANPPGGTGVPVSNAGAPAVVTAGTGPVQGAAGAVAGVGGAAPVGVAGAAATAGTGAEAGAGGAAGSGLPNADACTTTTGWEGVSNETTMIPGAVGVYVYGDGLTTACLTTAVPGEVCLAGIGADAGADYANYGAGVGVQLATPDAAGAVASAADLATQGVVGFRLTVTGAAASKSALRIQMTMVDEPGDGVKWSSLSFLTDEKGISADGPVTFLFADFMQPSWADAAVKDAAFDATMIHSLQYQFTTVKGSTSPFDVCISGVEWIDAADMPVAVIAPPTYTEVAAGSGSAGMGGAGGESAAGAAGMGGMGEAGMGGAGGMGEAGMGAGGMGDAGAAGSGAGAGNSAGTGGASSAG